MGEFRRTIVSFLVASLLCGVCNGQLFGELDSVESFPVLQERHLGTLGINEMERAGPLPLSKECMDALKYSLNNFTTSRSVLNLLWYSGKKLGDLGDYINCLKVEGRYFVLDATVIKIGLCFPSGCSLADVNETKTQLMLLITSIMNQKLPNSTSIAVVEPARKNDLPVLAGTIVTLALLVLSLLSSIIAAVVDTVTESGEQKTAKRRALAAFNILKNSTSLLYAENRVDKNLDLLNGCRTLAMGWIMFGHVLALLFSASPLNIMEIRDSFYGSRSYSFFASASLAVDAFFCLTGFLGILVTTEQLRNPRQNKLCAVLLIYFHRYIRLLPIYGMAILVTMYILPYLYDGPLYYTTQTLKGNCYKDWIYNLLYVNNFISDHNCCSWTWYIANDFQMYLLVPPLVLLAQRSPRIAYLTVFLLMLGSFGIQLGLSMYYGLRVNMGEPQPDNPFRTVYYQRPYCRANPFFIGVILAWMYIAHKKQEKERDKQADADESSHSLVDWINTKIKTSASLRYCLYVLGLALTSICVFLSYDFYKPGATKSKPEHYAFLILRRPTFVIGLWCWFYPGCLGKARVIRPILGHELFNMLAKVVYSGYMFNMITIAFYHSFSRSFTLLCSLF